MGKIIKLDGFTVAVEVSETPPTLSELQEFVGGYIEITYCMFDGETCQMIINEEGKLRELPVNVMASGLHSAKWGFADYICGPALVLSGLELD